MNTMELVRFVERARPRQTAVRSRGPLYFSELIGPTRQAILLARQFLLNEQRDDGSWLGSQRCDATLPSQLIFWLAFSEQDDSQLAQRAAAAILAQQLPNGGWSLVPKGMADVSTSVQAYFALKITGMDASDGRLRRARQVIRQLGGADTADSSTRFFLALLDQIDYDCCPVAPPEALTFSDRHSRSRAPISIIWSLRAVQKLGIERGVRELFIKKPCDWVAPSSDSFDGAAKSKASRLLSSCNHAVFRFLERHGWVPLRRRTMDTAESCLRANIGAARIEQLNFFDLIWHAVAARAIGLANDSHEIKACEKRLREMVSIDAEEMRAFPSLTTPRLNDTTIAIRALRASGTSVDHGAIAAAMRWLSKRRRSEQSGGAAELANIVGMLRSLIVSGGKESCALPPEIEARGDRYQSGANRDPTKKRLDRVGRIVETLTKQLLLQQLADGGWGVDCSLEGKALSKSSPDITGEVLETIGSLDCGETTTAIERAVAYLRVSQCADGRWESDFGTGAILATSRVVCGLVAAGVPTSDESIAAGVNWLMIQQQSDGGFGGLPRPAAAENHAEIDKSSVDSTASHTAAALIALVVTGSTNHPAARRAVDFLIEAQSDEGRWDEPQFIVQDAASGRWFRNELHSVTAPLLALSKWAVAAAANHVNTDDRVALRLVSTATEA